LDFIALIDHEMAQDDGAKEKLTVKCTRNAAASIALACSESSYEQAALMLNQLAGMDLTTMTEFRVTDCVASEFVKDAPVEIKTSEIEEMAEKMNNNVLETKVKLVNNPDNKEEIDSIIQKAIDGKIDGVLRSGYKGPVIQVMYILCDGTGVPGRHLELVGIKGKQPDGSAKTFEAKIGAVFIVEYTVDGKPLLTDSGEIYRDKNIRYMGTVRKVDDFSPMLYQHAVENGLKDMDAVVFLGDGAQWVWGIQNKYFPYALTALDLYHSIERLNALIGFIQFKGRSSASHRQVFTDKCVDLLRRGEVREMLDLIEALPSKKGNEKKLEGAIGYFISNMEHMDYGRLIASGIFVGSGVIEAGCKVIVGNRMKNAGMHWSKNHAEKMIALRCAIRNGTFLDSYLHNYKSSDVVGAA
jgi:hypothetical protein